MLIHSPLRNTLVAVVLATGLLLSAASAQGSPVARDPFVNNAGPGPTTPRDRPSPPSVAPVASKVLPSKAASAPVAPAVVARYDAVATAELLKEVKVNGIVSAHGKRQAILNSGSGSYIVGVGQKVGDFRVKTIDATSVTLAASGQTFRLPLAQEF